MNEGREIRESARKKACLHRRHEFGKHVSKIVGHDFVYLTAI